MGQQESSIDLVILTRSFERIRFDYKGTAKRRAGVIEKVSELEEPGGNVHYLPHHAVSRRDAETTKRRIVYDASSKESKNGTPLNPLL